MRAPLLAATAALMLLTACGDSDPLRFIRGDRSDQVRVSGPLPAAANLADPRPTVDQVVSLRLDRAPGGLLVTAIGLPPTQGWHSAALLPETVGINTRPVAENGVISYRFVASPPPTQEPVVNQPSREISAGTFISDQTLGSTRTIVVKGANNQRSASR
ncbi:MAG: hypothetical protein AAFR47_23660 [Pseudomonadota bacterium]